MALSDWDHVMREQKTSTQHNQHAYCEVLFEHAQMYYQACSNIKQLSSAHFQIVQFGNNKKM